MYHICTQVTPQIFIIALNFERNNALVTSFSPSTFFLSFFIHTSFSAPCTKCIHSKLEAYFVESGKNLSLGLGIWGFRKKNRRKKQRYDKWVQFHFWSIVKVWLTKMKFKPWKDSNLKHSFAISNWTKIIRYIHWNL